MPALDSVIDDEGPKPGVFLRPKLVVIAVCVLVFGMVLYLTIRMFATWRLEDFANTFYPAGNYLFRGENVYLNSYPHPTNGREYPPYAPIWALYSIVPLVVFPLQTAEALRFLFDLAMLPFLAYLCTRWAKLGGAWLGVLLVLAPWHVTEMSTGQWTVLVFLGVFLSYWGARHPNPGMMATGLWLLLIKPNIVALIILAAVIYAWRARILLKTMVILAVLVTLSSLAQPGWFMDLLRLFVDRLAHPRPADSILLLPGYPWSQIVLLATGALGLIVYSWRSKLEKPTPWLWALLLTVSLVGAPHTFVYDWQLLMLPLALLLNRRWGIVLAFGLYLYAIFWAVIGLGLEIAVPSPAIIPAVVLIVMLCWRIQIEYQRSLVLRHA